MFKNLFVARIFWVAVLVIPLFASDPCQDYHPLNDAGRSISSEVDTIFKCDKSLIHQWYRFTDGNKSELILNKCAKAYGKCGTISPGWMQGTHPAVADDIVNRTVCFYRDENCCASKSQIQVKNCGSFMVYRLPPLPNIPVCRRYCTTAMDPCDYYDTLSDISRSDTTLSTNSLQQNYLCDDHLNNTWYRFKYGEVDHIIKTECIEANSKCGTYSPGWMLEEHPTVHCSLKISFNGKVSWTIGYTSSQNTYTSDKDWHHKKSSLINIREFISS
ncbi:uncharacterized protein TRIADDRAFT_54271 [Trichoplax adhaerens]|uniref:UMOD/GP2/OIT3-like D8C domain-containing protein n=1 Tax=Trichoplax adhaerens TaxID=10228 RepID=B3RRK1_TRIAD|nr:hypothetical protein TRIADDRAFT_54271 [Trichoplax adhaerens]EDV26360.1 hypothetical protein TRIADDRAFT_54271 [Trichoplax adhaerens]|eukprot:XP_002110356.1 hypothetical protein TRIADDRAFT_54271 [Trichoplax adhaerens]